MFSEGGQLVEGDLPFNQIELSLRVLIVFLRGARHLTSDFGLLFIDSQYAISRFYLQ